MQSTCIDIDVVTILMCYYEKFMSCHASKCLGTGVHVKETWEREINACLFVPWNSAKCQVWANMAAFQNNSHMTVVTLFILQQSSTLDLPKKLSNWEKYFLFFVTLTASIFKKELENWTKTKVLCN